MRENQSRRQPNRRISKPLLHAGKVTREENSKCVQEDSNGLYWSSHAWPQPEWDWPRKPVRTDNRRRLLEIRIPWSRKNKSFARECRRPGRRSRLASTIRKPVSSSRKSRHGYPVLRESNVWIPTIAATGRGTGCLSRGRQVRLHHLVEGSVHASDPWALAILPQPFVRRRGQTGRPRDTRGRRRPHDTQCDAGK